MNSIKSAIQQAGWIFHLDLLCFEPEYILLVCAEKKRTELLEEGQWHPLIGTQSMSYSFMGADLISLGFCFCRQGVLSAFSL